MNQREKMLAVAVALLVVALVGRSMYGRYQRALETRTDAVTEAQKQLMAVNRKLAQGRAALRQMQDWQTRSLPADQERALTLYKAWLLEKAKAAGLEVSDITPPTRSSGSGAYKTIGYTITAKGSLPNIAAMLYEFYHSPQLHQVTKLQMNRPQGASEIEVSMEVEALSLPGAEATDKLPEGDSKRLRLANVEDYKKTFEERDLASVYTPPRPPGDAVAERSKPPAPPKFDDAEQAHFSGSTAGPTGAPKAWINVRTTGETMYLSAGDDLKIGTLEGKIVSVDNRSLVYETGGKKFRVALGESLRKGKELPADASPVAEKPQITPES
jgi:hypothetical protein